MGTSTLTRAVPSSVGRPVARDVVADALLAATDGATIMASGLPYGGSGIIVGGLSEPFIIRDTVVWPLGAVRRWVQEHAPLVTNAQTLRRRAYGAWRQGSDLHLDIIEIFPDDEELEAIVAGRLRDQISIWHAGRQHEIPTGGTGGVPDDAETEWIEASSHPSYFRS